MSKEVIDHRLKTVEMVEKLHKTIYNQDQKISDLETKLADLQEEQTKEMQEHQEAMKLADKTITNLVEDNRASQEWYKKQLAEKDEQLEYFSKRDEEKEKQLEKQAEFHRKSVLELKQQLADTEEQNKRVLEKLELIVSDNQELEQKLAEHNKYFKSFSCEDFNEFKDFISTFMLTTHEEQTLILELKQQLAESEETIKYLKGIKRYDIGETLTENIQLKQQLAKKEEQVQKSQEMYFETLKELDELEDEFNNTSLELWAEKIITQDKILFTIEQLEKVKEFNVQQVFSSKPLDNFIDNQIKQLKEME